MPNCHNVETCDIWKKHEEVKEMLQKEKAKQDAIYNGIYDVKKDWKKKAHNINRSKR